MNILKFLKPKACVDFVYDDNTARQALEKMKNHSFTAVPVIESAESDGRTRKLWQICKDPCRGRLSVVHAQ